MTFNTESDRQKEIARQAAFFSTRTLEGVPVDGSHPAWSQHRRKSFPTLEEMGVIGVDESRRQLKFGCCQGCGGMLTIRVFTCGEKCAEAIRARQHECPSCDRGLWLFDFPKHGVRLCVNSNCQHMEWIDAHDRD